MLPPQWQAPTEDGQILLWPDFAEISNQAYANQKLLNEANLVRLNGVPLPEIRRYMRKWIDAPAGALLIGAGHQVELFHAGVWAKNILLHELAEKLGGAGYQFSIDTDAPKHLNLHWPGASFPITDDKDITSAQWTGLLNAPTPAHLQWLEKELDAAANRWNFRPVALGLLHTIKRLTLDIPRLAPLLISALHELDWSLGLRHTAMAVAPLWHSDGYLLCIHHLAARANDFAADYNAVLHDYRREKKIRSPGRPWPDLKVTAEEAELPLWLDFFATGQRLRASVRFIKGEAVLSVPGADQFIFKKESQGWEAAGNLKKFLTAHRLRLSPRALILTMFLRLIVCDQFIHGIGGALYDEITDRLIRKRLKIDSPSFCVTTATLLFPSAADRQRVNLPALLAEGRRLRHGSADGDKMKLVQQIAALPRRSPQRSVLFHQMHARLGELQHRRQYQDWQRRLTDAQQRLEVEKDLFDRELFYALQPAERLQQLMERYRSHLR